MRAAVEFDKEPEPTPPWQKMIKEVISPLFALFVALSLVSATQAQSRSSRRVPKPAPDTCPGPWHQIGFDGFKVGMRVPGGMKCLLRPRTARDEYRRRTSANEYAIRPYYENDDTESRLHPSTVLARVSVRVDQPRPVAEVFADLTEIRQVCAGGCRIVGLQPSFNQNSPKFVLFPEVPTDEQRTWAVRAAAHMLPREQPDNPIPVIYFYWEQKQVCTHFDNGSLNWPILRVEFSVADVTFPLQHPIKWDLSHCSEPGLTDLGELRP